MLKKYLLLVLGLFVLVSCSEKEINIGKVSYHPEKPTSGNEVIVKLSKDSSMSDVKEVYMKVFQYSRGIDLAEEKLMKSDGNYFESSFIVNDTSYGAVIVFDIDGTIDANSKSGYRINFYKGDRIKTGSEAGYALALSDWGYYADLEEDRKKALEIMKKEIESDSGVMPIFIDKYIELINVNAESDSLAKLQVLSVLDEYEKDINNTETELNTFAYWYSTYSDMRMEKYVTLLKEKFPKALYFQNIDAGQAVSTPDLDESAMFIQQFEQKYPNSPYIAELYKRLIYNYNRSGRYAMAYDYLKKKVDIVGLDWYYRIGAALIESPEDAGLANIVLEAAIKKADEEMKNPSMEKPKQFSERKWKNEIEYNTGLIHFLIGKFNNMNGKTDKALEDVKMAYQLTKGENSSIIDTYSSYLMSYEGNKYYAEAKELFENLTKENKNNEKTKEYLQKIYESEKGNLTGFEEYYSKLIFAGEEKLISKLKSEMIKEEAPDFKLLNLDEKEVSKVSLKGKIVIVDFWATWCGPCLSSFPGMQKAVNELQNDNVQFIFINSWENVENKKENAMKFISDNKYTFNVLLDEKNEVIKSFGVTGIPTKFIIDKEGFIRFKAVGFMGNTDQIKSEIAAMIKLIG